MLVAGALLMIGSILKMLSRSNIESSNREYSLIIFPTQPLVCSSAICFIIGSIMIITISSHQQPALLFVNGGFFILGGLLYLISAIVLMVRYCQTNNAPNQDVEIHIDMTNFVTSNSDRSYNKN